MCTASVSVSIHLTGKSQVMHLVGEPLGRDWMNVSFSSAALAALCNSERRLTQRWGQETGRTIARRLLDLAAVDATALDRLPGAKIDTDGTGETTIMFGQAII